MFLRESQRSIINTRKPQGVAQTTVSYAMYSAAPSKADIFKIWLVSTTVRIQEHTIQIERIWNATTSKINHIVCWRNFQPRNLTQFANVFRFSRNAEGWYINVWNYWENSKTCPAQQSPATRISTSTHIARKALLLEDDCVGTFYGYFHNPRLIVPSQTMICIAVRSPKRHRCQCLPFKRIFPRNKRLLQSSPFATLLPFGASQRLSTMMSVATIRTVYNASCNKNQQYLARHLLQHIEEHRQKIAVSCWLIEGRRNETENTQPL